MICEWDTSRFLIFSDNGISLIYYSHFTSIAIFFCLFLLTFLKLKPWPKNAFRLMSLAYISWLFFDLILWGNENIEHILFFWTLINLVEPLIFAAAYAHFVAFIEKRKLLNKEKFWIAFLLAPTLLMAPLGLSVIGFDYTNCDRNVVEGIAAYYNYFLEGVFILLILFQSISKFIKTRNDRSLRYRLLLATLSLVFLLCSFLLANFLGTYLDDYTISQFGHIAVPIFAAILAYITIKFETFEPRIMVIDVFSASLVTLVFSLLFIDDPETQKYIVLLTLVLSMPLVYTLVSGIRKEVRQREKIEKLAVDLEKANTRLRELDQLKSEFLSFASHQLRSPLTAIDGYASMLLEGDFGEMSEKVKDSVKVIETSSKSLVKIVNEFLDISRIEQGRMKYELADFDAKELAKEVVKELRPNVEQKGLSFKFEAEEKGNYIVNADVGKIKQVIGNIIDNSIKYTPQGGVTVHVGKRGHNVMISVADTGIGIEKEDISRLFSKFTRAKDANKTNVSGTGLGLYVAKQMIEAQKGKVWVESEGKGKGSTFFIELQGK